MVEWHLLTFMEHSTSCLLGGRASWSLFVCVLHIKRFFLLVDIHHTQYPRWF